MPVPRTSGQGAAGQVLEMPGDSDTPRMRGWLHAYGFFAAILCGVVLCALAAARPGLAPVVSSAIYSLSACGLLGVSALYHRRRSWTPRGYRFMRRLDHSMIFLFIAGTYVPFCILLLPSERARLLLAVVCGAALGGIALKLLWPYGPRWLSSALYIALGCAAVTVLPDILHRGGVSALVLLLTGGVLYSLGAVFYALRRPNPWPTVFGHHEFFHACTLAAAICHHIAVYFALYA